METSTAILVNKYNVWLSMVCRVTRVEFDICPTEEAARDHEELLICVLNPRFNGAGKWPCLDLVDKCRVIV